MKFCWIDAFYRSDDRVLRIPVLIDGALTVRWRMRQTLLKRFSFAFTFFTPLAPRIVVTVWGSLSRTLLASHLPSSRGQAVSRNGVSD